MIRTCASIRNSMYIILSDIQNCSTKYTQLSSHGGGNMVYLDRHRVRCNGHGRIVHMFHLQRFGERIRYQYGCCNIAGAHACVPKQQYSAYSDDGGGQAIYLDRHAVNCGTTGFIADFRLERNPSQGHIRYKYSCCMLISKWSAAAFCYDAYTNFTFDGNGRVYYLDRQTVQCNPGYALSYFQLQRSNNQYRYQYRCCTVIH